jgi:hypothetical protein
MFPYFISRTSLPEVLVVNPKFFLKINKGSLYVPFYFVRFLLFKILLLETKFIKNFHILIVCLFVYLFSWRYNPLWLYFPQPGSGL